MLYRVGSGYDRAYSQLLLTSHGWVFVLLTRRARHVAWPVPQTVSTSVDVLGPKDSNGFQFEYRSQKCDPCTALLAGHVLVRTHSILSPRCSSAASRDSAFQGYVALHRFLGFMHSRMKSAASIPQTAIWDLQGLLMAITRESVSLEN